MKSKANLVVANEIHYGGREGRFLVVLGHHSNLVHKRKHSHALYNIDSYFLAKCISKFQSLPSFKIHLYNRQSRKNTSNTNTDNHNSHSNNLTEQKKEKRTTT